MSLSSNEALDKKSEPQASATQLSSKVVISRLVEDPPSSVKGIVTLEPDSSSTSGDGKENIFSQFQKESIKLNSTFTLEWMNSVDWFNCEYEYLTEKLDFSPHRYLLSHKDHLFSLFELQRKILSSSHWFKTTKHSIEDEYCRSFQLAIIKFAKQCRFAAIPDNTMDSHTCWAIGRKLLVIMIQPQLTDIGHYASAVIEIPRYTDVHLCTDKGKKIVEHLQSAIKLSQLPIAFLELGNLYRNKVDLSLTAEASLLEAKKYYCLAAEQGICSAQKYINWLNEVGEQVEDISQQDEFAKNDMDEKQGVVVSKTSSLK